MLSRHVGVGGEAWAELEAGAAISRMARGLVGLSRAVGAAGCLRAQLPFYMGKLARRCVLRFDPRDSLESKAAGRRRGVWNWGGLLGSFLFVSFLCLAKCWVLSWNRPHVPAPLGAHLVACFFKL